jgi:hypothetical protein
MGLVNRDHSLQCFNFLCQPMRDFKVNHGPIDRQLVPGPASQLISNMEKGKNYETFRVGISMHLSGLANESLGLDSGITNHESLAISSLFSGISPVSWNFLRRYFFQNDASLINARSFSI